MYFLERFSFLFLDDGGKPGVYRTQQLQTYLFVIFGTVGIRTNLNRFYLFQLTIFFAIILVSAVKFDKSRDRISSKIESAPKARHEE